MIGQVKFYFTPMFPVAREASDIIESRLPLFYSGYGEGVEMVKTMNYGDSVYKILGSLSTNCQVSGYFKMTLSLRLRIDLQGPESRRNDHQR